ncbi:MAG: hypothetical protein JW917_07375 [Ignavibacteria bacterium]|nr:hypothetical protein [Ignavibacteria bacterium]
MTKKYPEEINRLNEAVEKIYTYDFIKELIQKASDKKCEDIELQFYLNEVEEIKPMYFTKHPVLIYLGEGRYLEENQMPEEDEYCTLEVVSILNLHSGLFLTAKKWIENLTIRDRLNELIDSEDVSIYLSQNNIDPEDIHLYGLSALQKNITFNPDSVTYPMISIMFEIPQ